MSYQSIVLNGTKLASREKHRDIKLGFKRRKEKESEAAQPMALGLHTVNSILLQKGTNNSIELYFQKKKTKRKRRRGKKYHLFSCIENLRFINLTWNSKQIRGLDL